MTKRMFLDDFSGSPHTDLVMEGDCPNKANHTPMPVGYIARQEWAKKMAKTHTQITCQACGMYAIWLPKAEAKRELARRLAEAIAEDARCRDEMAARRKTP